MGSTVAGWCTPGVHPRGTPPCHVLTMGYTTPGYTRRAGTGLWAQAASRVTGEVALRATFGGPVLVSSVVLAR